MADETTPQSPKDEQKIPRLRTYAADMHRAIRTRGETLSSIVSREQEAKQTLVKDDAPRALSRTRIIAAAAIALSIGAIALVVGAVAIFGGAEEEVPHDTTIIFPNATATLSFSNDTPLTELLATERMNTTLSLGEVEQVIVTQNAIPIQPAALARYLGFPDEVAREVSAAMVGIHAFDQYQPFIIFEVNSYDRTFSAMLEFEPEMARVLGVFFRPTSSVGAPPQLSFEDAILRNVDVRQSVGGWPVMYAYPARTLLVITTNEFTLRELIARLGNTAR